MQKNCERKNSQYEKMTSLPVKKLLIELSIPSVISMMVMNIYNLVDTAFVGTLGTSQSGATGIVFSFMAILQAIAFMCGHGSGSIIARRLGEKNDSEATVYSSTGFFLSFTLGTLLGIGTFIFMEPLLTLLGSTSTIMPYAKTYISWIAIAAPFFTSSLTMNNILRYEGKARLGTIGMMAGAILNIGLDAFFMLVLKMGITGAGVATAVSQIISFAILLYMFVSEKTQTKISLKFFSHKPILSWNIFTTGFPSLLRQGLNSISALLLNRCAGEYGDAAISAMSCVSRISFFAMALAIGIGQGFQPISSFNYGANRTDRVRKAFWTAITGEEIVLFMLAVPMFIFSPQLILIMRDDNEVIKIGSRALRLMSIAHLFVPLTMMVEMGFQSIGARLWASIGSSLRNGILFIPALLISTEYRSLSGIQEAQPLSFALSFIVGLFMCRIFLGILERKEKSPQ